MLTIAPAKRLTLQSLMILTITTTTLLTSNFAYATATPANEGALITLYGKTGDVTDAENVSRTSCTIDVAAAGSSRTVDVLLNNPDSPCYGIRVSSISMANMPAATQVLLTDDYRCDTTLGESFNYARDPSTNKNWWIRFKTGAAGAKLVEESLSALQFKGFASNSSPNGTEVSKQVRIEDFKVNGGAERMTYTLSCVRIKTSTNESTKFGEYYTVPSTEWSEPKKESDSTEWECPAGQVMTGRKHKGDEQADTQLKCVSISGVQLVKSDWSKKIRECGVRLDTSYDKGKKRYRACNEAKPTNNWTNTEYYYFPCPVDQVMVGRGHGYSDSEKWPEDDTGNDKGDENGRTNYRCASLYQGAPTPSKDNLVTVVPGNWDFFKPESGKKTDDEGYPEHNGEFECPKDQVLVGRGHRGDENNLTAYQCARLRAPATH